MTTNTTTANTANLPTAERDRLAYEYRRAGHAWARVALLLGYANESSARTAGNRHAARIGEAHGHVANRATRRTQTRATRTRTFGVEIEFIDGGNRTATKMAVARAIADAVYPGAAPCSAYGIHIAGYHGSTCRGCSGRITHRTWHVESDASVDSRGDLGGEAVSPVLTGETGIEEMKVVMQAIKSVGAAVDTRCGMHVHVGADRMTNAQRANVIETLFAHHGVLDRVVAPSRRNNHYCAKPSAPEITQWANAMRATGQFGYANRYKSINVTSFAKYGTIEVRYHQGTLNGRKAAAWVRLLIGLFDTCAKDEADRLAPGLALFGSLAEIGALPQQDAAYLIARAETLATR